MRGRGPPQPFPPRRQHGGNGGFSPLSRAEGDRGSGGHTPSLEQNAQTLVELKRRYKQAKSLKERHELMNEARRLIRRTSFDPSTQDEKSVTVLLNSAVTFNCDVGENLEQAVQWMRRNLGGLSPQNVALFTNAIGSLDLQDAKAILHEEVVPIVKSHLQNMTPVEIVMILQAFQRLRIKDDEEVQNSLVLLLEPCIETMHISELSTLATALAWHPLKATNEAKWCAMVECIMKKVMNNLDRVHSKEAITFLAVSSFLEIKEDQLVELLRRVTTTSGFHTDEQVGELFRALARIQKFIENPKESLVHAYGELQKALLVRLERVAQFASLKSTATIWTFSSICGVELPAAVQTQLLDSVMRSLVYHRPRFVALYKFVKAAGSQKLPSVDLFNAISDYSIGKRPPRPDREEPHSPNSDADDSSMLTQAFFFKRFFPELASLRLYLENVFAINGATLPESLTTTLPQELLAHIEEISPKQALVVVRRIALAPDNVLRNTKNDEALLSRIEARMRREGPDFMNDISPTFLAGLAEAINNSPKTKNISRLLQNGN